MTFNSRRLKNSLVLFVVCLLLNSLANYYGTPLYQIQIVSGWVLMILILLLFFYSLRKKLTLLPIGKTSSWLQFHSYAGFLSVLVFFQHLTYRLPNGFFEIIKIPK